MRGSVVVIGTRNKQPYFSLNKDNRTQLIYLGKKREDRARQYAANCKRLRELVEEMTQLNMALLKENCDIRAPLNRRRTCDYRVGNDLPERANVRR